jgi:hypothetical protein
MVASHQRNRSRKSTVGPSLPPVMSDGRVIRGGHDPVLLPPPNVRCYSGSACPCLGTTPPIVWAISPLSHGKLPPSASPMSLVATVSPPHLTVNSFSISPLPELLCLSAPLHPTSLTHRWLSPPLDGAPAHPTATASSCHSPSPPLLLTPGI